MTRQDFQYVGPIHCGLRVAQDFKDKWGFVDQNFDIVIPLTYPWVNDFDERTSVGTVKLESGYRFIDTEGNFVGTMTYDDACNCNGEARIFTRKSGNGFLDPVIRMEVFYKDLQPK